MRGLVVFGKLAMPYMLFEEANLTRFLRRGKLTIRQEARWRFAKRQGDDSPRGKSDAFLQRVMWL